MIFEATFWGVEAINRDEQRYQLNDLVWVDRGAGLRLPGQVISYRGYGLYRVGIEGFGVRSVGEREMLRATELLDSTDIEHDLDHAEGRSEQEGVARSTLQDQLDWERERADRLEEELREARRGVWSRLFGG